jgi:hypothetical protein
MEALITLVGAIGMVAILIIYGSLSWGFVTYTFYNWFILSSFPDLPHFTITQFIGFSLFLNTLIRHGSGTSIKDEYRDKSIEYGMMFLNPWFVLFFGWVLKVVLF